MINTILLRLAAMGIQKILIIGLALGGVYYMSFYDDGTTYEKSLETLQVEIAKEEGRQKESDAALREAEKMRASVGALSEQYQLVSQALPSEVVMSEIIRSIDQVSMATRVSVKAKEPRPTKIVNVVEEVPLHVQMEGTYSQLTQFLYYASSLERIMSVRAFSLTPILAQSRGGESSSVFQKPSEGRIKFEGQIISYRFVGDTKTPGVPK